MIAKVKPLYQFERDIVYHKHIARLQQIKSRSTSIQKSEKERPWVKESFHKQLTSKGKKIEEENSKLLVKLLDISTKNKSSSPDIIRHRENPYRRKWLKNIKKQNQQFGEKLIHLRSSLEYGQFSKSIEDYQKVKRSMMINRKAKLPLLMTKKSQERLVFEEKEEQKPEDIGEGLKNLEHIDVGVKLEMQTSMRLHTQPSK